MVPPLGLSLPPTHHLWEILDLCKGPFTCTISVPISVTVTVKFTLTGGIGSEPNLSIKWPMTIGTVVNFDSENEGYGHRDGTCKWASTLILTQYHVGIFLRYPTVVLSLLEM